MKILAVIVGVLVLAFGALAVFAPRDFHLERSVVVERPKVEVFEHLRYLKNHDQWNAWMKVDPQVKRSFQGEDGTRGFISSWESENPDLGTADQEIKAIIEGERIETEIRFKKPFEADFESYVKTQSVGPDQTQVTMGMYDVMPFPMYIISFIFNTCLGQQEKVTQKMEDSLQGLKATLEQF